MTSSFVSPTNFTCPHCKEWGKCEVKDSRGNVGGTAIRRRRQCEFCQGRFTTHETISTADNSNRPLNLTPLIRVLELVLKHLRKMDE